VSALRIVAGFASFVGLVRDHHAGREVKRLEYSAYAPMAEAEVRGDRS
jgi:molybdopterin synthase catalytic subunit